MLYLTLLIERILILGKSEKQTNNESEKVLKFMVCPISVHIDCCMFDVGEINYRYDMIYVELVVTV